MNEISLEPNKQTEQKIIKNPSLFVGLSDFNVNECSIGIVSAHLDRLIQLMQLNSNKCLQVYDFMRFEKKNNCVTR